MEETYGRPLVVATTILLLRRVAIAAAPKSVSSSSDSHSDVCFLRRRPIGCARHLRATQHPCPIDEAPLHRREGSRTFAEGIEGLDCSSLGLP